MSKPLFPIRTTADEVLSAMHEFRQTVSDHGSVQLMMVYASLSDEWQDHGLIAKNCKLTKSAMSRNIKKLEQLGVAESTVDPLNNSYKKCRLVKKQNPRTRCESRGLRVSFRSSTT